MSVATSPRIDVADVKAAAAGRELEVLVQVAGIPSEYLDGKPHPCPNPQCGGTDRFRLLDAKAGAVRCNQCFAERCGDFIAAVRHYTGRDFPAAVAAIADHLGMRSSGRREQSQRDIVETMAALKAIPLESFKRYGAHEAKRGSQTVARVPVVDQHGKHCGDFDIWSADEDTRKGKLTKGSQHGLYLPTGRMPKPGETWLITEGPKDAPALDHQGYNAAGLCTCKMAPRLARVFRGCVVLLLPDRDGPSVDGFARAAKLLDGVAAHVGTVTLPLPMGDGGDVRDLLRKKDGEELLVQAIKDAMPAKPRTTEQSEQTEPLSNGELVQRGKKLEPVPLRIGEIITNVRQLAGDFPRVANGAMFVIGSDGVDWLERRDNYFGWLQSLAPVRWHGGLGFVSRGEVRAEHFRVAQRYDAIEQYPHEPRIATHFYLCGDPKPGNGETLAKFLDFFTPETDVDRDLLQAALMTMAWGGPGGKRPLFMITAKGRGSGKTTAAELLGAVFGGVMCFSMSEKSADIKQRLLSPEGLRKRVSLIDNVKTTKISSGDIEALVTASEISGRRLYVGEASRPNTMTWFVTVNGAALSKDMAQRSVVIRLERPKYRGNWDSEVLDFIQANRQQIIADVIGALRGECYHLAGYSRWGMWEKAILERIPEPNEAQAVIRERQEELDADSDEAKLVSEAFAEKLEHLNYDATRHKVLVPTKYAIEWLIDATARPYNSSSGTQFLKQLIEEGDFPNLRRNTTKKYGRGFVWDGNNSAGGEIKRDLEDRANRPTQTWH